MHFFSENLNKIATPLGFMAMDPTELGTDTCMAIFQR